MLAFHIARGPGHCPVFETEWMTLTISSSGVTLCINPGRPISLRSTMKPNHTMGLIAYLSWRSSSGLDGNNSISDFNFSLDC